MPLWGDEGARENMTSRSEIRERKHRCIHAEILQQESGIPLEEMCSLSGHCCWSVGTVRGAVYCRNRTTAMLILFHYCSNGVVKLPVGILITFVIVAVTSLCQGCFSMLFFIIKLINDECRYCFIITPHVNHIVINGKLKVKAVSYNVLPLARKNTFYHTCQYMVYITLWAFIALFNAGMHPYI